MSTSLKLAPVNSSHIYARRHSAHACTATEDRRLNVNVSTIIKLLMHVQLKLNLSCYVKYCAAQTLVIKDLYAVKRAYLTICRNMVS